MRERIGEGQEKEELNFLRSLREMNVVLILWI
jgi:hypothetical protein